jgi:hypothetical protein
MSIDWSGYEKFRTTEKRIRRFIGRREIVHANASRVFSALSSWRDSFPVLGRSMGCGQAASLLKSRLDPGLKGLRYELSKEDKIFPLPPGLS